MSHYDEEWRDLTYKHAQEDRVESFLDKQAAKEKEADRIQGIINRTLWPEEEKIDDDVSIGEPVRGQSPPNKYSKPLRSWNITIDVYDVLDAFDVSNPATAHAIKKLLCTGTRGLKDWETDLQEAIDSLEQAKKYPPVPF